jgi:hypothetical protein
MPDVFISYAHEDNESPPYPTKGWVERFYDALKARLSALRREENTSVWLDKSGRVSGATVLTPAIKSQLAQTGVLVTILSPAYRGSDWCADELRFFRDAAIKDGGMSVATRDSQISRVFKILKVPINVPVRPEDFRTGIPEVDESPGYVFFDSSALELDPPLGENNFGIDFLRAVSRVAADINSVLQALATAKPASSPSTSASQGAAYPQGDKKSGPIVYLADTSSDVADYRDRLRQELEQFGATVLPATQQFPGPSYADQVKSQLDGARLSIHLIGKNYGMIPEGASDSIVELQYKVACEAGKAHPELARMLWMAPGTEAGEDRQRLFIAALQNDSEFKVTTFEEFKTLVHDALVPKPEPEVARKTDGAAKGIYLIFDIKDRETAHDVDGWLRKRGFTVWKRTGDESDQLSIELHKERLEVSTGVVIYYGVAKESWLQSIELRLHKDFALKEIGRKPSCIAFSGPEPPDVSDPDFEIIPAIPPDRLEEFARKLEAQSASA